MTRTQGKVAAVTGAGSGIGRALALGLAGRGARVVVSDVHQMGLAETVDLLKSAGAEMRPNLGLGGAVRRRAVRGESRTAPST